MLAVVCTRLKGSRRFATAATVFAPHHQGLIWQSNHDIQGPRRSYLTWNWTSMISFQSSHGYSFVMFCYVLLASPCDTHFDEIRCRLRPMPGARSVSMPHGARPLGCCETRIQRVETWCIRFHRFHRFHRFAMLTDVESYCGHLTLKQVAEIHHFEGGK